MGAICKLCTTLHSSFLPLLVVGAVVDYCSDSSVCPAIAANVQALLNATQSLGCCSHDACPPLPGGSAMCALEMVKTLQHCTQEDYDGDRAVCIREMVQEEAPAVCGNMWRKCEALRTLTKYIQLAQAVSGCPSQVGMVFLDSIFAAPQALPTLAQQGLDAAETAATPILSAADCARIQLRGLSTLAQQGLAQQGFDTGVLDSIFAAPEALFTFKQQGLDAAATAATPILSAVDGARIQLGDLIQGGSQTPTMEP